MLTVHHLGISQSDRIVWLCEELGIPYELKHYQRDPITRLAPQAYRELHPFGTAPVVTDGDMVLPESAAIIEYLSNTYGEGQLMIKPGDPDYAQFLFWFHFANGSMMPSRMMELVARSFGDQAPRGLIDILCERSDRAFDMIEMRLRDHDYLCGTRFTAADVMMLFPLTTMREFAPRDLTPYPHIQAYLQRIAARPAFVHAMARADPGYSMQLA
jgi:glutathione S-transferase